MRPGRGGQHLLLHIRSMYDNDSDNDNNDNDNNANDNNDKNNSDDNNDMATMMMTVLVTMTVTTMTTKKTITDYDDINKLYIRTLCKFCVITYHR